MTLVSPSGNGIISETPGPTEAGQAANLASTNFGQLVQRIVQSNSGKHRALVPNPRSMGVNTWEDYKQRAIYYTTTGNLAYAEALWLKAIAVAHTFTQEDPRRLEALESLATLYFATGRFEQAEVFAVRALDTSIKANGPDHQKTVEAQEFLSNVCFKLGRYDEAVNHAQAALAVLEMLYGIEHPKVATACFNLGVINHTCCAFDRAEAFYKLAHRIRARVFGPGHSSTLKIEELFDELALDRASHAEARVMIDRLIGA